MKKTALITTTIRVPEVLKIYRSFNPEVGIFVAGDKKTLHREVGDFVRGLGTAFYYSDIDQEKLGYESSEIIGWNKIMRRNIALLEAVKWGAEIIVTVDDDNFPVSSDYFNIFQRLLSQSFSGREVFSPTGWINAGAWLKPQVYHRGFPYEFRHIDLELKFNHCTGKKIGVAAGLWYGDPDIDAVERLANQPMIEEIAEEAQKGFVMADGCVGPFNTQNTAFLAEIAPLLMVYVSVGRFDDIFASITAQKIMSEEGFCVHYGKPFVRQERNPQSLIKNLEDEIFGMKNIVRFRRDMFSADLGDGTILEKLKNLAGHFRRWDYLPPVMADQTEAWCRDFEKLKKEKNGKI